MFLPQVKEAPINDKKEAEKTIKTIKYEVRVAGRDIPFTVLFARLSTAFVTKTSQHLIKEFDRAGVDVFDILLIDQEPCKSIFSFGEFSRTS